MAKDQIYFFILGVYWSSKIDKKNLSVSVAVALTPELLLLVHFICITSMVEPLITSVCFTFINQLTSKVQLILQGQFWCKTSTT